MLFGSKPTYLYGEVFQEKFSTPERTYKIDPVSNICEFCPARFVDGELQIFFSGPIFNTVVEHVEKMDGGKKRSLLRSPDSKRTVINQELLKNKLYTVRSIKETPQIREVELYSFNTLFPGYKTRGTVELRNGNPTVITDIGSGSIQFQSNEPKTVTECLLYRIEGDKLFFVEVGNPVIRCTVKVTKDLGSNKVVENGNIKGILIGCRKEIAVGEMVDVFVKKVCLGSYVFVEDIELGPAVVELMDRVSGGYRVKFRDFTGICYDSAVKKRMKGRIVEVHGDTFTFKRDDGGESSREKSEGESLHKNKKYKYEQVDITKRSRENKQPETIDQFKVIEELKGRMEAGGNVYPLFKKYILTLGKKDELCLFYLKYLEKEGRLDDSELLSILHVTSKSFPDKLANENNSPFILRTLIKKKKNKTAFLKLLEQSKNKEVFIKRNKQFIGAAVEYYYQNHSKHDRSKVRKTVEEIIEDSIEGWLAYVKQESGPYKRELFRRLSVMECWTRDEMKRIFEKWYEFEEETGGDTAEVEERAKVYAKEQL